MARRFVLEHRGRAYALDEGVEIGVGRGEGAEVRIEDDQRVSRHHATFALRAAGPVVLDRQSRNGVLVNGAKIDERATLKHEDKVTIGAQVFTVRDESVAARDPKISVTRIERRVRPAPWSPGATPPTEQVEGVPGLLLAAAEEALGSDRIADAKHAASALVDVVGGALALGARHSDALYAGMSRLLIRLAQRGGDPGWLDELFDLHRVAGRVVDPDAVFALTSLDATLRARSGDAAQSYLGAIAASRAGTPDAMRLKRLELLFPSRS